MPRRTGPVSKASRRIERTAARRTSSSGGARARRATAPRKRSSGNGAEFSRSIRKDLADRKSGRFDAAHFDAWINNVTALGTSRDKRMFSFFLPDVVTDTEAINLWRSDDVCRKIVEARPKTAFRRGITLKIEDKELAERAATDLEELQMMQRFVTALCFRSAFGGGAIYPVVDDNAPLTEPLDENNIESVSAFHVFEPRELHPVKWYEDINHPKFRQVEIWRFVPINNYGVLRDGGYIHESRLIIFQGRRVTNQIQNFQRPGWGDSDFTGTYSIVRDFGTVWGHVGALVQDFSQGVLSMDKYAEMMQDAEGEAIVRARIAMFDFMRSTLRVGVVGKDDKFTRETTPMSGLSEILHDYALRVAAAVGIPVTLLFGMAPAGLNATGDNDVRAWYDEVAAWREQEVKPALEHAVRLYLKSRTGAANGNEPAVWSVEFPPLWEPSELEEAQRRQIIATTDQLYSDMGGPTIEEIMESRWRGDTYSAEMVINWKDRDAQKKAEATLAAQAAKLAANANDGATGAPGMTGAGGDDVQATALNGAQVSSMLEIIDKVATKMLPRAQGIAALMFAFPTMTLAAAESMMPPDDFVPAPKVTGSPFGGGGTPAPAAPEKTEDEGEEAAAA